MQLAQVSTFWLLARGTGHGIPTSFSFHVARGYQHGVPARYRFSQKGSRGFDSCFSVANGSLPLKPRACVKNTCAYMLALL